MLLLFKKVDNETQKLIRHCRHILMVFLERIKDFTIFVAEMSINMKYSVTLRNLPFEPHKKQVIYVENLYCERMNAQIRDNYSWFKRTFRLARLDFVYLPMFFKDVEIKEKVLYYAPYLTEEVLQQTALSNSFLLDFMSHPENREKILPSLLYAPKKVNGEWVFSGLTIDTETEDWIATMQHFSTLISEIKQDTAPTIHFKEKRMELDFDVQTKEMPVETPKAEPSPSEQPKKKLRKLLKKFSHELIMEDEVNVSCRKIEELTKPSLDDIQEEDVDDILRSIDKGVEKLLLKGISLGIIHEFIDKRKTISRLFITDDLRIILPEYNNKEVKLTPLHKAVYLLFLYHPEGIVLKRMEDYHQDLVFFYRKTSNVNELTPQMLERLHLLEAPITNNRNIVLAKIREAFYKSFDPHLANHYIIQGKPGEPYKIDIDRNLLVFEQE